MRRKVFHTLLIYPSLSLHPFLSDHSLLPLMSPCIVIPHCFFPYSHPYFPIFLLNLLLLTQLPLFLLLYIPSSIYPTLYLLLMPPNINFLFTLFSPPPHSYILISYLAHSSFLFFLLHTLLSTLTFRLFLPPPATPLLPSLLLLLLPYTIPIRMPLTPILSPPTYILIFIFLPSFHFSSFWIIFEVTGYKGRGAGAMQRGWTRKWVEWRGYEIERKKRERYSNVSFHKGDICNVSPFLKISHYSKKYYLLGLQINSIIFFILFYLFLYFFNVSIYARMNQL